MAYYERKDRVYDVIVYLGYDGSKRKTKTKRVDLQHLTHKQAEKEIILIEKAFEDEVKGLYNHDNNMKLNEFVNMWLEDYACHHLRPKTLASYKYELDNRILPELGFMKISQIKPMHLIKFYGKLSKGKRKDGKEGGLSERTIKYQHQILSSILGRAVKWQVIKDNPCKSVDSPKITKKKTKKSYEVDEVIIFLEAIQKEKLKYICASELAILGGLRTEEVLGDST